MKNALTNKNSNYFGYMHFFSLSLGGVAELIVLKNGKRHNCVNAAYDKEDNFNS